jgi:hypothetical protein
MCRSAERGARMPNSYAVLNSGSVVVEFWTGHITHGELADLYGQVIGRLKVGRMALLVNKETYERALVFLKEVEGYGVKVIVFNSIDIACTWLGLDVNMARKQLQVLQGQSKQMDSSPARS